MAGPETASAKAQKFSLRRLVKKFYRRLLIWVVALVVAFLIPLIVCGIPTNLDAWEKIVLSNHKFTDVFMAVIAMVVLSGSNLFDNIIVDRGPRIDDISYGLTWTMIVLYAVFLICGLATYGHGEGQPGVLTWNSLVAMLLAGVVGELLIAYVRH